MVTLGGPAEQESDADWRAVELHPLKSSPSRRTITTVTAGCRTPRPRRRASVVSLRSFQVVIRSQPLA